MKIKKPICKKSKFTKVQAEKILKDYDNLVNRIALAANKCNDETNAKRLFIIWDKLQKCCWLVNEIRVLHDR